MFKVPNEFRLREGAFASNDTHGCNGVFMIPVHIGNHSGSFHYQVIASDGAGWEHVSVIIKEDKRSYLTIIPSWQQMCYIKDMFWSPEDCVVQFHPPHSEYVNDHENVLHLWRPKGYNIMTPPSILVGTKKKT